jgi:hypothetical protein
VAAKYVVAGGKAPWPLSPYLTYGPLSKTVFVGDVVDDLPGSDISYLLEAGYIVAESDWVKPVAEVPAKDAPVVEAPVDLPPPPARPAK